MQNMNLDVKLEKTSPIQRKLTIKVPASIVASRFNSGLAEVQRTAHLKGFRKGQAPISVIKQHYAEDIRHRLYHNLIDESLNQAMREHQIMTVGQPKIAAPDHQHGQGEHDHGVHEDRDLVYIATVEILPEIEPKGYTGISLTQASVEVKDEDIQRVVDGMLESRAEVTPLEAPRAARMKDHVEIDFDGGLVTETGVQKMDGMKGRRMLEIGSNSLIPGFEEELVGMNEGDEKTFRIKFPAEYHAADFAGKDAEFFVKVHSIKQKKLPMFTDEFCKEMGYEGGVKAFREKAREFLMEERTGERDQKMRGELLSALIEKNPFEVPAALIETQTRALAQDWAQELTRQGIDQKTIEGVVMREIENLRKRAEGQVRTSLILEAIAKKENISVSPADLDAELAKSATEMKADLEKVKEFYAKNPGRLDDLEFRMRQDRTIKFLTEKAKISKGK